MLHKPSEHSSHLIKQHSYACDLPSEPLGLCSLSLVPSPSLLSSFPLLTPLRRAALWPQRSHCNWSFKWWPIPPIDPLMIWGLLSVTMSCSVVFAAEDVLHHSL